MKKTLFSILTLFVSFVAYAQQQGIMVGDTDAKLITSASQISSPYTEPSEGSIEAMLDGDPNTFWHSTWTDGVVTPGTHYFEVEVSNLPEHFAITFTRRNITRHQITQWGIFGAPSSGASKNECTLLATWETPYTSNSETLVSPVYESQGFTRLRFYCESNTLSTPTSDGFFHLAEFQILGTKEVLIRGDMNNDGSVSIADVTSLVNVVLGKSPIETVTLSSSGNSSGNAGNPTSPFTTDNSLVVGTWYAPDGTHFTLNEDGTTDFPGGSTYKFFTGQNRLLILNASGLAVRALPIVEATTSYLLVVDYVTGALNYYTHQSALATGITLSTTTLSINSNSSEQLTATLSPATAFGTITWSSSDESVATVDANGVVSGVTGGTCTITATISGSLKTATCTVTVTQMVTSIVLSQTALVMELDEFVRLTATVLPENAANKNVTWVSSNPDIAPVRSGRVDAYDYGEAVITCEAADGSGVVATCVVLIVEDKNNYGVQDGHIYIDLGLPSGTLWATMNIGATSPEDYGDYFAWGETEGYYSGKTKFDWSTYKWCKGDYKTMTKYCTNSNYGYNGFTDNKTELDPEDDAAYVNWGPDWRMPSFAQMNELKNSSYTTTEWTTVNGVNGRKITSKTNGNSIFLPAAGRRYDASLYDAGSYGDYWSRTLYSDYPYHAWLLYFRSDDVRMYDGNRYYGRSIRPVRNQ